METKTGVILDNDVMEDVENTQSDAWIARSIAKGDKDAWDRFFDRYFRWTYRFAYYHLKENHTDAEDLCSDILLAVAQSIKGYDPSKGSLDVWLRALAKYRLAHFCRRKRYEICMVADSINSQVDEPLDICGDPARNAGTVDLVNRVMASLPERQSGILREKYVDGYSVKELAGLHETSPKAIESLLSRARSAFRSTFNTLRNHAQGSD